MNLAILWDIENVTPPAGDNIIQTIIDKVTGSDNISCAMAFGDWNEDQIKNIALELSSHSFELIHIPKKLKKKSRKDEKPLKNGADISLSVHGIELIFQCPHIEKYILFAGDSDYRPFLLMLRKYGKESWVICDATKSSEELLKMANKFSDYRELIDINEQNEDEEDTKIKIDKPQSFDLFYEAVGIMQKENKKPSHGSVKIKMKLLDSRFDEKSIGYRNWSNFVNDAMKNTGVKYLDENAEIFTTENNDKPSIPEVFKLLLENINNNDDVLFNNLAKKIDYKNYGYKQFKLLALEAEKRGYIKIKVEGTIWSLVKT